ncbi:hypothetical protein QBC45DRAFT_439322 [Copromyces sp. CBS 386.78]|nr:hypothetical protein QBC45DRAFT_439322 [Copromyces sp. CBS 386.78]
MVLQPEAPLSYEEVTETTGPSIYGSTISLRALPPPMISLPLPSRRYTIDELKELHQPSIGSATLKFSSNLEVGNIIRGSGSESSDNKPHLVHKPRHWDECAKMPYGHAVGVAFEQYLAGRNLKQPLAPSPKGSLLPVFLHMPNTKVYQVGTSKLNRTLATKPP